ncbi:MAG: histidine triad nucleotide-binding protein [Candidatus Omnitrophica bacterium]|nr:histidine triad nucleotide-binding protein [Candidatus Omnitrophota bacterium]
MEKCLFCGIAEKEIPAKVVYEDGEIVAFHDVHPQAPIHVVVIPRRHWARISEWGPGDAAAAGKLILAANRVAQEMKITGHGYRLVMNCNAQGGQTVYHIHLHLLGGRPMQWPPG